LEDAQTIAGVADVLVLTEWKLAKTRDEAEAVARTAREQTHLYAAGVLAGIELSRYRYIVLVSPEQLAARGTKH